MPFKITLVNNQLTRQGRPNFLSSTQQKMVVAAGRDRRHILHGCTQIIDVLITIFNSMLRERGTQMLEDYIDNYFNQCGINFKRAISLEKKVAKVISIAFSREENLVIGAAVGNQGIEKARSAIKSIRKELDNFCAEGEIKKLSAIKDKVIELIDNAIGRATGRTAITAHKLFILNILREGVEGTNDVVPLILLLSSFELSCTLDIVHNGTTKEQNVWGITMANKLQRAIYDNDEQAILELLLSV